MTDTSKPAPAKPPQRLTLSFLYATVGETMMQQLGADPFSASIFPEEIAKKINAKRQEDETQGDYIKRVVKPVMETFLATACPAVNPHIAQWVCKQYLANRIAAGNLQEVKENLAYFDSLKKSGTLKETDTNPDLLHYKTYAEFEAMLMPYLRKKAEQEAKAEAFHLEKQEKARILAETTVLYDGPEGKVVVPLTSDASQLLGSNTKWCLGTWIDAPEWFATYNNKSPVIMLLPSGRPDNKVALVDHTLYDSADARIGSLSKLHHDLMDKCLAGLSEGARRNIAPWMQLNPMPANPVDLALQEAVRKETGNLRRCRQMDAALWHNPDFVLGAMQYDCWEWLDRAAEELLKDREFIRAAIRQDGRALAKADCDLRQNRSFVTQLLETEDQFLFSIRDIKKYVWTPDDTTLAASQIKALERMAEKGDIEKFVKYARRFKCTWGDADALFAADPAATLVKIKAEVAAQYPKMARPSSARMGR